MLVVTITAADGYVYAREVSLEQVDSFVEDCVAVLRDGEGVTVMAAQISRSHTG